MATLRDNWSVIIVIAVAAVIAALALRWLGWRLPQRQMQDRIFKSEKERADTEDNFRKTVGQARGGAAVLIGGPVGRSRDRRNVPQGDIWTTS